MANVDTPNGFKPVCYKSGAKYSGAHRVYWKDATAGAIGIGDPVIRVTNSSDAKGRPEIVRATTGAAITGVVVGFYPNISNLDQRYFAAATTGYVMVADDPDLYFEVQDNGGASGIIVTQVGEHVDSVTALDCDSTTGVSKYELDTEAVATNNTWRIEALSERVNNAVGANARWIVSANLHTEVNASASNKTEV